MPLGLTSTELQAILTARIPNRGKNWDGTGSAHTIKIGLFNVPTTAAISAVSQSGNVVTVTTTGAHGLAIDDRVQVAGCTPSGYNGHYDVTSVPSSTTFTYTLNTSPGSLTVAGTFGKWTEVSGGSYAKYTIASSADWAAATGVAPAISAGPKSGAGPWAFPQATAQWASSSNPIIGFGLYDNTDATYFDFGTLDTATAVNTLDTFQFDSSNQLKVEAGDQGDPF